MLITTSLAAQRLGVSHERLLGWIARKLLPIAGEDEEGRILLREPIVAERGEALATEMPERLRSPRLRQLWAHAPQPRVLRCGCVFEADATPGSEALVRCPEARALDATAHLAEALAAAAPNDQFFHRFAAVVRSAVASHFGAPCAPTVEAHRPGSTGGEVEHLVARSPPLLSGNTCICG